MEYGIPREAATEAIRRVVDLVERRRLPVAMPYEVRFTKGDDAHLSTAAGRDTCYIAVHQYRGMDFDAYFRGVERIMDDYGGRPHWGKRHFQTAATLAPRYPDWDAFQAVRHRLDPDGVFANEYVERVLGQYPQLVLILVVALGLRVGLVVATPEHVPWGDPVDYHRHAVWLTELGTYPPSTQAAPGSPAAFRPPACRTCWRASMRSRART